VKSVDVQGTHRSSKSKGSCTHSCNVTIRFFVVVEILCNLIDGDLFL
jgi:hypothetical protein